MSDYELKDGQGSLFPQTPKTERHPTWNGKIHVNGKVYWLSGWDRKSKNGTEYLSLSVGATVDPKAPSLSRGEKQADFEDDIPFAWAGVGLGSAILADYMEMFSAAQNLL